MIDFGSGYRNLCISSQQQVLSFIEKQIDSYPLFEKLLGFTFSLNELMFTAYDKVLEKIEEPKIHNTSDKLIAEGAIVGLCGLNLHSIWHALRPLEQNSIQNCSNVIRPVFESIPKMFYALTHPEDIYKIFLREEFGLWLSQRQYFDEINQVGISKGFLQKNPNANQSDYEYLYLECYLNHNDEGRKIEEKVKMLQLVDDKPKVTKNAYKSFKGKFNNDWFRNKIYTEQSLALQNTSYASFSMNSHANFARVRSPIRYDPEWSPRFFKILTHLAFYNLYIYFNAAHERINEMGEIPDTISFIRDAQKELKHYFAMTDLYPDVPEYYKNLILYPENRFNRNRDD